MKSSALKHRPWAEEHKEKAAHPNTPEAHGASPLKNANFRYQDVRESSPVKFEEVVRPNMSKTKAREDFRMQQRATRFDMLNKRMAGRMEKMGKDSAERLKEMRRSMTPEMKKLKRSGTGFMKPPYKDTVKGTRPYAKRQGYHGYKNFESNIKK